MESNNTPGNARRHAVWDLPTRLFHWLLLIAVIVSIVAVKVLDDIDMHLQSGQVVLGLLVFRLLWGMYGSSTAQFHRFVRGPRAVRDYLTGKQTDYIGHSPLGALSVVAMLASLAVQVFTGLCSDDEIYTTGPLVQYLTEDQVALAGVVHEWNIKILVGLIALHVAAIAFYGLAKKMNLIMPMIIGSSDTFTAQPAAQIRAWPWWVLSGLISAGLAWLVFAL